MRMFANIIGDLACAVRRMGSSFSGLYCLVFICGLFFFFWENNILKRKIFHYFKGMWCIENFFTYNWLTVKRKIKVFQETFWKWKIYDSQQGTHKRIIWTHTHCGRSLLSTAVTNNYQNYINLPLSPSLSIMFMQNLKLLCIHWITWV